MPDLCDTIWEQITRKVLQDNVQSPRVSEP